MRQGQVDVTRDGVDERAKACPSSRHVWNQTNANTRIYKKKGQKTQKKERKTRIMVSHYSTLESNRALLHL